MCLCLVTSVILLFMYGGTVLPPYICIIVHCIGLTALAQEEGRRCMAEQEVECVDRVGVWSLLRGSATTSSLPVLCSTE